MSPGLIEAKTSFMRLVRNSSIAAPNQNLNGLRGPPGNNLHGGNPWNLIPGWNQAFGNGWGGK